MSDWRDDLHSAGPSHIDHSGISLLCNAVYQTHYRSPPDRSHSGDYCFVRAASHRADLVWILTCPPEFDIEQNGRSNLLHASLMSTTRKLRHYQQQTPHHVQRSDQGRFQHTHAPLASSQVVVDRPHTMDSAMATATATATTTTTANQTTQHLLTRTITYHRSDTLLSVMCHTTQHSTPTEFHTDRRGCKNRTGGHTAAE